ncbi:MAG TPA: formylglycine-generating enzyme family protein, partial [Polyangiaceae bacterium]|nr:formylglycine-generating enzyme family protein [Polyangiaceae bacterium]
MRFSLCHGAAIFALGGALACSGTADPQPQWVIHVSTDAPLPQLGDRLLVETLSSNGALACSDCRRVVAAGEASDFPISFGVVPNGQPLLLRSRLYRSGITGSDGQPRGDALIDHVGLLPDTTTRVDLAVVLALGCFGLASDLAARKSCSPETLELADLEALPALGTLPVPGSAELAAPALCPGETPPDMQCVPGGLFLRGNQGLLAGADDELALPEQLTRLRPFFLDQDEVTVGQVRELIASGALGLRPVLAAGGESAGCTYVGQKDAVNDLYPVNCVSHTLVDEACRALGKRLPTEAEWEYAAGNQARETPFPWGSDLNVCAHSITARAVFTFDAQRARSSACASEVGLAVLSRPERGGDAHDVTDNGIRNLAGNVTEFVADAFASYTAPCWGTSRVLDNPRCDQGDNPSFPVTLRGS